MCNFCNFFTKLKEVINCLKQFSLKKISKYRLEDFYFTHPRFCLWWATLSSFMFSQVQSQKISKMLRKILYYTFLYKVMFYRNFCAIFIHIKLSLRSYPSVIVRAHEKFQLEEITAKPDQETVKSQLPTAYWCGCRRHQIIRTQCSSPLSARLVFNGQDLSGIRFRLLKTAKHIMMRTHASTTYHPLFQEIDRGTCFHTERETNDHQNPGLCKFQYRDSVKLSFEILSTTIIWS